MTRTSYIFPTVCVYTLYSLTGKWTRVVTTTRVTHATPASAYAHVANRYWESDADIPSDVYEEEETCTDIAKQLIYGPQNSNINVVICLLIYTAAVLNYSL
jgi:alkaline phosphatase